MESLTSDCLDWKDVTNMEICTIVYLLVVYSMRPLCLCIYLFDYTFEKQLIWQPDCKFGGACACLVCSNLLL